jgi:DNA primase large subunit
MALEDLRKSEMMSHLMDALKAGQDIGHYGRLTFVMVARHFLSEDEVIQQLTQDPDCDEEKARGLLKQVEARGYTPPKPDRILDWMNQQDFPICQPEEGQESCNVYKSLKFPPDVYNKISSYYQNGAN